MTEVERILDQLKRAYEGSAWYGSSVREVPNFVTAEQAHARPFAEAHSIWELTHHIAVWENAARRRLSGDRAQIEISSPEDWPPADDPSEAAWEKTKASLDRGSSSFGRSDCLRAGIASGPANHRRHVHRLRHAARGHST